MTATAAYSGANYTVAHSLPAIASLIDASEWGGNVKVLTDSLTISATLGDTGSLLYVGKLPKHSIPLMTVITSPATRTWTGTIGWAGATSALGTFAAGTANIGQICGVPTANSGVMTTQNQNVYITTATAAMVSADVITTAIFYVNGA